MNEEAKALSDTDPEQSLAIALKAQVAARGAKDVRGEAEALNYVAYGYRSEGLLDVSKKSAEESIRLYQQAGDRWGEAQGYNTLGLIEADAGRFPDALDCHLKALAIREKDGDKEGLAYTYNNLGNTYRNMGAFEKALEYHRQGLALKIELKLRSSEAYSHQNIGLVYFAMQEYGNALAAYRRALAIREELRDPRSMAVSMNAIGQVEALSDPAAALRTYDRALALRRQTGDTRGEMATELNRGDLYRRLRQLPQSAAAFNRALAIGATVDAPLIYSNALRGLAETEAASGDYASAYRHHIDYHTTREAMFNQENTERFQRMRIAHERELQDRQIAALEQQAQLRAAELTRVRVTRVALGAVTVLVLVMLKLLHGRYRAKQQSEARFKSQAEALAEALERVKTLRGLLPICSWCKKIREDNGYWTQVESYFRRYSAAEFTHCICPACYTKMRDQDASQSA